MPLFSHVASTAGAVSLAAEDANLVSSRLFSVPRFESLVRSAPSVFVRLSHA